MQPVCRTWLQTTCSRRPAHDGRYGAHDCSHPGVADAEPLERCVAASVEEDVEGAEEARQGVYRQREQGDSGNSAGESKGHGVEGTDKKQREDMRIISISGNKKKYIHKAEFKKMSFRCFLLIKGELQSTDSGSDKRPSPVWELWDCADNR